MSQSNGQADIAEPYTWQCPKCSAHGKAATKRDAKLLLRIHLSAAKVSDPERHRK